MTDALQQAYAQALTRWPDVSLDMADFVACVQSKRPDGGAVTTEALATDDLFLAAACLKGDPVALRRFDEEFLANLAPVVASVSRQPDFVAEVRQVLAERLLTSAGGQPKLAGYSGRGPLRAFVNVAAIRTALNAARGTARRGKHEAPHWSRALVVADTADPELEVLRGRYREVFAAALEAACGALTERERAVLRLHFVDGLTVDRLGAVYAIHRSTAARWVARAREQLVASTRQQLGERLGATASEIESLQRLLETQLDVSVRRLLGGASEADT